MSRSVEAQKLSLGVLAHSRKANERRLPIHPAHLHRIDHRVSQRMYLEHGYGERYGVADGELAELVGGIRTREQLIAGCDALMTLEWVHHHENLAISGASGNREEPLRRGAGAGGDRGRPAGVGVALL